MWDLGGQESLRAAWNTYYSNTEVSIFLKEIHSFTYIASRIPKHHLIQVMAKRVGFEN